MAERARHVTRGRLDKALSMDVAARVGAKPKRCYANAMLAVQVLPEMADAYYVEGYAMLSGRLRGVSIEHAWVEMADGRIVDPTTAALGYRAVHRYRREEILSSRIPNTKPVEWFAVAATMARERGDKKSMTYWSQQAKEHRAMLARGYRYRYLRTAQMWLLSPPKARLAEGLAPLAEAPPVAEQKIRKLRRAGR